MEEYFATGFWKRYFEKEHFAYRFGKMGIPKNIIGKGINSGLQLYFSECLRNIVLTEEWHAVARGKEELLRPGMVSRLQV